MDGEVLGAGWNFQLLERLCSTASLTQCNTRLAHPCGNDVKPNVQVPAEAMSLLLPVASL